MELLDKIYIPDTTFCLKMPNKYKILYDYLLTDSNDIRTKTQFVKILFDKVYKCILYVVGVKGISGVLELVNHRNDEEYETNDGASIKFFKCKSYTEYGIDFDCTAKILNIPNYVIKFYKSCGINLLDNEILINTYTIHSLTILGPQNENYTSDLEYSMYTIRINIRSF
jgi:hypothetical protein